MIDAVLSIKLWWDGFLGIISTKQSSGASGTISWLDAEPGAFKLLSSLSCVFLAKVMDVTDNTALCNC